MLTVELEGTRELQKQLSDEPVRGAAEAFLTKACIAVQTAVRPLVPVDTGHLRNSIMYDVQEWQGRVGVLSAAPGTPLWYKARAVEYGTGRVGDRAVPHKPTHWPPPSALDPWARRHGFDSGATVARLIGLRGGLRARSFLREGARQVERELSRLADEFYHALKREWTK